MAAGRATRRAGKSGTSFQLDIFVEYAKQAPEDILIEITVEYFHSDNGARLGASHQTGWTGLVAKLIQLVNVLDPQKVLKGSSRPTMTAR